MMSEGTQCSTSPTDTRKNVGLAQLRQTIPGILGRKRPSVPQWCGMASPCGVDIVSRRKLLLQRQKRLQGARKAPHALLNSRDPLLPIRVGEEHVDSLSLVASPFSG